MAATTTRKRSQRSKANSRPADDIEYGAEILRLCALLAERDSNPDCVSWPVIDIYARISKITDALDSEKVPRQIVDCLRRMLERDWRLGVIFADPNRSAWKLHGKRPEFEKLMARISSGANQGVLCWNIDRLFRQPWDLERLLLLVELKQKEKDFYLIASCHEEHRLKDQLTLRIKAAVAAEESRLKSERIRRLNETRRAAGIVKGGVSPFGHRQAGDTHISDAQLSAERTALEWGIRHVADGGSLGSVSRNWNERGITTRNGELFNPLNVRAVLLSARHAGLLEYNGQVLRSLAGVEPIVDKETFLRLRGIFDVRKRGRQAGETAHFLSGLIFCDGCGKPMVGSTYSGAYEDGEPCRQYRCTPRGCRRVAVDARAAEFFASLHVATVLSSPGNARRVAKQSQALAKVSKSIQQYDRIIDDLNSKGMAYPDQYEKYAARVSEMEDARKPLLAERDRLLEAGAASVATSGDLESVADEWKRATPAMRRIMVEQALPGGFFVAPVGKGRRLRGEDILQRFSLKRGEASSRFS